MDTSMAGAAVASAETKSCAYPSPDSLLAAQQQFDHLVRTALKPCERWICRDRDFEDRRQEGLGRCWQWYARQVAGGTVPDTALVVHACRLAMVNRSRTLVGHEHRPRRDVYDRQCHGVELRRIDAYRDGDDDEHRRGDPSLGLARLGVNNPEVNVVSAMDLDDWLEGLEPGDRELVEMRGAGFGFGEIGKAVGRSTAGAFRRARQLGGELAERAGIPVMPKESRRAGAGRAAVAA